MQSFTDVQGSQTHTASFSTNDQQPIPVHFHCRKTTRLKSQTKLKIKQGVPRSKPTSKNETYVERTEPQNYASWQDNFQAVKQQVGSTGLSTELPSHIDAEPGGEPGKNQTAKQSKKDAPNTKNMCHGPGKGRGCTQSTTPKHTLSIAFLKVKKFKTNLNFVKELSNNHKILLLQEHWFYGFETAILEKIYDNCDYLVKCVDDADPILPVQPPRGYAGTGILWHKDYARFQDAYSKFFNK